MILQAFGGVLEVFVGLPEKREVGHFTREQARAQADTSVKQRFGRVPVGLGVALQLAAQQLRQQLEVVSEKPVQHVAGDGRAGQGDLTGRASARL